jgi:hypothetical protein
MPTVKGKHSKVSIYQKEQNMKFDFIFFHREREKFEGKSSLETKVDNIHTNLGKIAQNCVNMEKSSSLETKVDELNLRLDKLAQSFEDIEKMFREMLKVRCNSLQGSDSSISRSFTSLNKIDEENQDCHK